MESSYLESKIINLQARLRAELESEASQGDPFVKDFTLSALCSPQHVPSGRRPKQLGALGTPTRSRKQLYLPVNVMAQSKSEETTEVDSKMKEIQKLNGILNIDGKKYQTDMKDLEYLGELGNGTYGHVVKMLHKPSNTVIAVKQMRRSSNCDDNKRIIMDLHVVFKSLDCPCIVRYLGCFITESDVWICMELMATCFGRLLKRIEAPVPEDILGKVTLATVKALHYLKESHGVIHRDVKPSNILLDEKGNVKLCDFGISGRLVDSKARTKNAGCAAYMAPERIEPPDPRKPHYDIRADVWSLGITLVELATGAFPYKDCKCDFEVLSRVLNEEPPSLHNEPERFSFEFRDFVSRCLTKDYTHRPKYKKLLEHPFLRKYDVKVVDVASWYAKAISNSTSDTPSKSISTSIASPPVTASKREPLSFLPTPPSSAHNSRRTSLESNTTSLNGGAVSGGSSSSGGRYSPFRSLDFQCEGSKSRLSTYEYDGGKPRLSTYDPFRRDSNKYGSPLFSRRFYPEDSTSLTYNTNRSNSITCNSETASPLVLQRFQHQQNQHLNHHLYSYPSGSPCHSRSASLSPSRRYLTNESKSLEGNSFEHHSSKREAGGFPSFLRFRSEQSEDTVPPPAPPSPPPRYSRLSSNGFYTSNFTASPLLMRRNF